MRKTDSPGPNSSGYNRRRGLSFFGLKIIAPVITCLVLVMMQSAAAQQDIGPRRAERRSLIDCPTAFTLPRASFAFDIRTFPDGGVTGGVDIGLLDQFMLGLYYGVEKILGDSQPKGNPEMEFLVKLRIIGESLTWPAVTVGYQSQGSGVYDRENDRFTRKSKGFYGVFSKSFLVGDELVTWHAGVNYSLDDAEHDKNMSSFIGIDFSFRDRVLILAEYDMAFNDDTRYEVDGGLSIYGRERGYLNMGIEWMITPAVSFELDLLDILKNRYEMNSPDRELRLFVLQYF